MSATLEIVVGTPGLTASAKLYADGSDTLIATVTLTEATNRSCYYTGPATGLTGLHLVEVVVGSTVIGAWWAMLATSGRVVAVDSPLELTANAIADAVLGRGVGNVEDTADAHSLATIILGTTEYKIENSTWHIYKTDGVTLFVDKALSVSSEGHITQVQ